MSDEYRIEFQVQRKRPEDDDFVEVGFGSSGEWHSIAAAAYSLGSMIEHREWETESGQPDPGDIDTE